MIKSFHSIITIFASEKVMIDSYYTTDKGDDHYRTDTTVNLLTEEELALYKTNPNKISGIKSVITSILEEIHKKDNKKIYSIAEASLTFIAYGKDFDIIFIKPYSIYIDFLKNNTINVNMGYGLYGNENVLNKDKNQKIMS